MEDLIRVGALVVITVLSIQMGLFFNWAFLSLILKAMNRIRPAPSGSRGSSPATPVKWAEPLKSSFSPSLSNPMPKV